MKDKNDKKKIKTNVKKKSSTNIKKVVGNKNTKEKKEKQEKPKKFSSRILVLITFFSGIVFTVSTYAWLSVNVNVKVKSLNVVVSSDSGLFISLDGVNFSEDIVISLDSVINDLEAVYPSNTNQWASSGLWPVSSNGIASTNDNKFSVYQGQVSRLKSKLTGRKTLSTIKLKEEKPNSANSYIAFDVFLKNVSGSPIPDNLYLDETKVDLDEDTPEDIAEELSGIMNSMRFGFVKVGTVSNKAGVNTIQNIECNNDCQMAIYEPNSDKHSQSSSERIKEAYDFELNDGTFFPTYAIISEGKKLEFINGQEGSGIPLDTAHFSLQNTIKDYEKSIFSLPDGITKLRVYVWIEGQDLDSLEVNSKGAEILISINFIKDLAGYE